MAEHTRRPAIPPIGASSLLAVFAVLCLTVFALLALSDVRADAALASAARESVEAYYAADAQAQELLARLRDGQRPDGVTFSESAPLTADYAVPISEGQELQIRVVLGDDGYRILRWQSVSTIPWEGEGNFQVWTPE